MDEALDFILKATKIGNGSEIFVPKLRSYSILDVKNALTEILGDTGYDEIGIRPGEKLHEILINADEMRYAWKIENMYMILNPLFENLSDDNISNVYPNSKKINTIENYSSESVEKISINELKEIITKSNLL